MNATITAFVLATAIYRPFVLEDSVAPWNPDPIVRHTNASIVCEIVARNPDGTIDVKFKDDAGKWHKRERQKVIDAGSFDWFFGDGSAVILIETESAE